MPDNFPVQQYNLKTASQKQPIVLLNKEVNWQASDSSLSKVLHSEDLFFSYPTHISAGLALAELRI